MKNFKKLITLSVMFILVLSVSASAAVLDFTVGNTTMNSYNGDSFEQKTLDAAPFVNESDRTMVPVRAVIEAFDAKVEWDEPTQTVTITSGEAVVKLVIGNASATVNGTEMTLDSVPVLINSRTFVPLRFIGEALGYKISYCAATEQILIDNSEAILTCGSHVFTAEEFKAAYDFAYNFYHDQLVAEGQSEEQIKMNVINYVLQECANYLYSYNAFSGVNLNAKEIETVVSKVPEYIKYASTPMQSMAYLLAEKLQFSTLTSVISHYADSEELIELAKSYVCAKHILVEDEATAKEVYEKAIAGEDFDKLIAEYNSDPGMQSNPQGYVFTYGEMVESFEKAAFALVNGGISEPVKSDFGYHIIKRSDDDTSTKEYLAIQKVLEILLSSEQPVMVMSEADILALIG